MDEKVIALIGRQCDRLTQDRQIRWWQSGRDRPEFFPRPVPGRSWSDQYCAFRGQSCTDLPAAVWQFAHQKLRHNRLGLDRNRIFLAKRDARMADQPFKTSAKLFLTQHQHPGQSAATELA